MLNVAPDCIWGYLNIQNFLKGEGEPPLWPLPQAGDQACSWSPQTKILPTPEHCMNAVLSNYTWILRTNETLRQSMTLADTKGNKNFINDCLSVTCLRSDGPRSRDVARGGAVGATAPPFQRRKNVKTVMFLQGILSVLFWSWILVSSVNSIIIQGRSRGEQ